ncbi:MAG TPA: hypothetical protein VFW30_09910 [Bryocella sp.]|nr:hypothetical protein [Bryocella sp.]
MSDRVHTDVMPFPIAEFFVPVPEKTNPKGSYSKLREPFKVISSV